MKKLDTKQSMQALFDTGSTLERGQQMIINIYIYIKSWD